jgi:hypothetical protein
VGEPGCEPEKAKPPQPTSLPTESKGDLPNPSTIAEDDAQNWLVTFLEWKETPLLMASIQVLSIDGFPLIAGITNFIGPEDLAIAVTLYATSRAAAVAGTASTLYQYKNGLHGTQGTDAIESVVTTVAGFIPVPSVVLTSVHLNFIYTLYRYTGGELPPELP